MKKVIIVTPFRNSAHNLGRYFSQLVELRDLLSSKYTQLSLVAAEGDSVDNTKELIQSNCEKYNIPLNLLDVSHGQMSWKSVEDPRRLEAMSSIMNQGLEGIKFFSPNQNDVVVWLMSDIEYNPESITNLILDISPWSPCIISPVVLMGNTEIFYDTWAYRKNGKRFNQSYPYFEGMDDLTFNEIDSAGTCLIMPFEIANKIRAYGEEAVSFCKNAKIYGYSIYLAQKTNIYHIDVKRPKLLLVAEVLSISGNSRATHQILPKLSEHFEVDILGKNYKGQPHNQPYKIYPYNLYSPTGTTFLNLVYYGGYDVVIVQGDTFDVDFLMEGIGTLPEDFVKPRLIGWLAVDGMNQQMGALGMFDHVITWTSFGKEELVKCGLSENKISVIPLGVDTNIFKKLDKKEVRARLIPNLTEDMILVGSFAINHYRKRLDILLHAFSMLVLSGNDKVHLLLLTKHVPNGFGCDLEKLIKWFNLEGKITVLDNVYSDSALCELYNCLDIYVNCSLGEGFCLPILEAIACGVEVIAPEKGAVASWLDDYNIGYCGVECDNQLSIMSPMNNETGWVIGRVVSVDDLADSINVCHNIDSINKSKKEEKNFNILPQDLDKDSIADKFTNKILDLL